MSEVWQVLKKSLPCKPRTAEVHDPKRNSRSTQRTKHVNNEGLYVKDERNNKHSEKTCYSCFQGNEDGKGVEEPHLPGSTKGNVLSSKTHCVDCDECNVFSKSKKAPQGKEKILSNDPPTSTCHHDCEEKLKAIDIVEEHNEISENSVIQLDREGSSCKIIKQICQDKYFTDSEIKASKIECVLRVQNKQEMFAGFEECREMVRMKAERLQNEHPKCLVDGNELLRFHGTTIACSFGLNDSSTICTLDQCGVCQILRHGFSANQEFQGAFGVYTTSTSAKAIHSICSYNNNSVMRMCVMLCRVIAGMIHNPLHEIEEMTGPEFDSLVKKINDQSEIEELIVLNPRAVLPCFLVIYNF